MWIAKFKIHGSNALLGSIAKKHKVSLSGYPLSSHEIKDRIYVNVAALLIGEDKNKKLFTKDLKKNPRTVKVERDGDFLMFQIKESLAHKSVYKYNLIHIEPVLIGEDGAEFWTLGSWDKKPLIDFVDSTEGMPGSELLKIFQKKITNFAILSVQPELTKKQRKAMEIAIQNGYYQSPRKIELKKLAKILEISYSTYQAHLRKAEQKVLPFLFSKSQISDLYR